MLEMQPLQRQGQLHWLSSLHSHTGIAAVLDYRQLQTWQQEDAVFRCNSRLEHWRCLLKRQHDMALVPITLRRLGSAVGTEDALLPLHVTVRAPCIYFPGDSSAILAEEGSWTVERLSLHAERFVVSTDTE